MKVRLNVRVSYSVLVEERKKTRLETFEALLYCIHGDDQAHILISTFWANVIELGLLWKLAVSIAD